MKKQKLSNIYNPPKAFTLAEVLITLMIIGILAMVTIPSILQSWEERENISKLRKVYSVLKQAYQLAEIENGNPATWNISYSNAIDKLKPYLKIAKVCSSSNHGCVYNGYYKNMSGSDYTLNFSTSVSTNQLLLSDGTGLVTYWVDSNCDYGGGAPGGVGRVEGEGACFTILVDLNGPTPPNTFGKDFFGFSLNKKGIYPWGGISTTEKPTTFYHGSCSGPTTSGWGCARWVIERGNMNYLHKSVTW